jgi:hypothetical protein
MVQAITADMNYGISQNNLYRYNKNLFQYDLIYSFPSYQNYTIRNSGIRIMVTGFNSGTNYTNLTTYIFNDQSSGLALITKFLIQSYSQTDISSSPLLTRMGCGYQDGAGRSNIIAKYIDYSANKAVDLTFQDPVHFFTTVQGMRADYELDFNDYFLIARNGSSYNSSHPDKPPYEEGYQFIGTQLVFIRGRLLTGSTGDR